MMHLLFEEAMFLLAIHHTVHLHHEHLSTKHRIVVLSNQNFRNLAELKDKSTEDSLLQAGKGRV